MKYRKKPVVIDALRWEGTPLSGLSLTNFGDGHVIWDQANKTITCRTLEGALTASIGDWIIRGVKGEFYPVKDDIFRMTYEPVDEATSQA